MWICQQIIKMHGSKIRFHSAGEGCGTRFGSLLVCYVEVLELVDVVVVVVV